MTNREPPRPPGIVDTYLAYREAERAEASRAWTSLITHGPANSTIAFVDMVLVDAYGTATLGAWGGYLVQVTPWIKSDRLVLTPARNVGRYTEYGWGYPKGGAAGLAALAWSPDIQGEPAGFIERIGNHRRIAGSRARR